MSGTQRFLMLALPWWAAAMEAESREWQSTCACGRTFSVWDAGGIRFKARGDSVVAMRCPACGEVARRRLVRNR